MSSSYVPAARWGAAKRRVRSHPQMLAAVRALVLQIQPVGARGLGKEEDSPLPMNCEETWAGSEGILCLLLALALLLLLLQILLQQQHQPLHLTTPWLLQRRGWLGPSQPQPGLLVAEPFNKVIFECFFPVFPPSLRLSSQALKFIDLLHSAFFGERRSLAEK